jgi:hypothetical protein
MRERPEHTHGSTTGALSAERSLAVPHDRQEILGANRRDDRTVVFSRAISHDDDMSRHGYEEREFDEQGLS